MKNMKTGVEQHDHWTDNSTSRRISTISPISDGLTFNAGMTRRTAGRGALISNWRLSLNVAYSSHP